MRASPPYRQSLLPEALSERYVVSTSPFQDPNWMRQLLSPKVIDWLVTEPAEGFSFELAYGALPGSIETAGIILLMAMLGAVVLARKKVELDEAAKAQAHAAGAAGGGA